MSTLNLGLQSAGVLHGMYSEYEDLVKHCSNMHEVGKATDLNPGFRCAIMGRFQQPIHAAEFCVPTSRAQKEKSSVCSPQQLTSR